MTPVRYVGAALVLIGALAVAPGLLHAQTAMSPTALETAAAAGDAQAQYQLALRYHLGQETPQNYAKAFEWLNRAAAQGLAPAQNLLGRYFAQGLGVARDPAAAIDWLSKAAASGNADYLFDLGAAYESGAGGTGDPARAAEYYRQATEKGQLEAAVSLGVLYQSGTGVTQDFAAAQKLYEGAAAQGHPRALNNLGLMYARGTGVAQDHDRAAKLFAAAAETGLKSAIGNLAVMLENGFGVAVDEALAARLYQQAGRSSVVDVTDTLAFVFDDRLAPFNASPEAIATAAQAARAGDPLGLFLTAWAHLENMIPDASPRVAAQLLNSAASKGHGPSMANLGLLYFQGRGVPQDYVLGYQWLTLATLAGVAKSGDITRRLSERMTSAQVTQAQALAEDYWKEFGGRRAQ